MAAKRLQTWVPQVDPDDASHVDAYLLAKMQNKQRVSLQAVLANIKQQEHKVERSLSQGALFWVAPHGNFPKGLSAEQKSWLVTKEELAARYELPDDGTDYENVYVFSDACPRASLGKWVNQLKFSLKLGRTTRGRALSASGHAGEESKADAANDGPELRVPSPSRKKPRLQRYLSTTSSDEEDKTLTEIIKQCSAAAAAGRIYSSDATNTHTLHFWANAVASALPKHPETDTLNTFVTVKETFGKLLTKLLLNSAAYENLQEFEPLYKGLEEKGVKIPVLAAPLRKLMQYKIEDSNSTLGVDDVDLNAQRRFFTSPLWNQFEKQRAALMLKQAKDKPHGATRDNLLKLWDAVPQEAMCAETTKEVQMAKSLFLSTVPLSSRVKYALEDESHVLFAAAWKSDVDFQSLLYFGTTPGSFDGLTFKGFLDTYNLILLHGMQGLVKNAILKTIVEYGMSLAACTAKKTWWPDFLKLTVAVRLGLLKQWYGTEAPVFDETVVDVECIDKLEKETAKLLGNIKGDRPWMTALKLRSKDHRHSKPSKSSQAAIPGADVKAGDKAEVLAALEDTKMVEAEAESTPPDEVSQPAGTEVRSADAAASSAEIAQPEGTDVGSADAAASSAEAPPPSPKPKEEAPPKPQPVRETARGSKYVPPCEVGDIVLVKALREEYNGFKGKVLTVLTGDVKVEMLEGPAVHTKGKVAKIKFAQVKKVTDKTEKAEPEKKESKKEKQFKNLGDWLAEATADIP